MWFIPKYILVLFALIITDFFLAKKIHSQNGGTRLLLLWVSVSANIGALIFFKYFNFFNANIYALAKIIHWNYSLYILQIAVPLGLSFHVFQSLSYVIEVYRKKYPPENNLVNYALYVMFFPQLVAGPIERPGHLLPQIHAQHDFDAKKASKGLERILIGFFKKLVIADQLARIVNSSYANLPTDSVALIFTSICFTYQLYCDFSGYSDIALGSAMMLGYDLTENFNRPFASKSVAEFWRKWHISLSSWLKDYLYYPLVFMFKKISKAKLFICSIITFTLIGLWHGPNWTYVIFGFLQGAYLTIGTITENFRKKLANLIRLSRYPAIGNFIKTIIVFGLFTFSLIFFRATSLQQAWWVIQHIFTDWHSPVTLPVAHTPLLSIITHSSGVLIFLYTLIAIIVMEIMQYFQIKLKNFFVFEKQPLPVRLGWYYFLIFSIILFGYFGNSAFIYFKF